MHKDEIKARIRATLATHQKIRGMAVAMGTTCSCGFWTKSGQLIDHQSEVLSELVANIAAGAWDEGFEASSDWIANTPGPSGTSSDPPRNPYDG